MAAEKKYPLSLIIRAVDQLTGPLRSITAGIKRVTDPIGRIGKDFGKFNEAVGFGKLFDGFSGVGGALKNVGREAFDLGLKFVGMAGAAGIALYSIVSGSIEAGAEQAKLASRLNTSVDYVASLGYAANQAEIDQDSFNGAMEKFAKNLGAARAGGGSLLEFLQKVSPRLAEQFKHTKNAESGISLLTDAFKRLDDPAKRAILATEAFGKSGAQFGDFFHQGSAEIQRQQLEFLRLAGSQEDFANGSRDVDQVLKVTGAAFTGLKNNIVTGFYPALAGLAEGVTQFILDNRQGLIQWANESGAAIKTWIDGGGITRLVAGLRELSTTVLGFIDTIGGFKTVAIAAAALMAGPLLLSIVALVPAIVSLGVAMLTTPIGWFVLALAGITAAGVAIYRNWEPIKTFFNEFFPDQIKAVNEWVSAFKELYDLWKKFDNFSKHSGFAKGANGWEWSDNLQTPKPQPEQQGSFADAAETIKSLWNYRIGQPLGPTGPGSYAAATGKVQVTVDMNNLPKGTRVSKSTSGDAEVDVNAGYAMVNQ